MNTTVSISLDTARHAVTCIQARASEGVQLVKDAAADAADPEVQGWITEALDILRDLEAAQTELLAAIDNVEDEQ